jgi:hypothetical protein
MKRKDAAMRRFDPTGAPRRAGAALLAAAMIAGTAVPAAAAGEGASERADGNKAAQTRDMSVQEAWTNAKEDWRELEAASGDAWGEARQEFQKSWSRLQNLMSDSDGAAPPPDEPEQGSGAE